MQVECLTANVDFISKFMTFHSLSNIDVYPKEILLFVKKIVKSIHCYFVYAKQRTDLTGEEHSKIR